MVEVGTKAGLLARNKFAGPSSSARVTCQPAHMFDNRHVGVEVKVIRRFLCRHHEGAHGGL